MSPPHVGLEMALCSRYSYFLNYTDEERETWRGTIRCVKAHSLWGVKPRQPTSIFNHYIFLPSNSLLDSTSDYLCSLASSLDISFEPRIMGWRTTPRIRRN